MEIDFMLSDGETNKDINNFTVAGAIYNECKNSQRLNARVIAEMILSQCNYDDFQRNLYYGETQGEQ